MQEFDFSKFVTDVGKLLNLKVSAPVSNLLKMILKSPIYVSPKIRTKYLEAVKEIGTIENLKDARTRDIQLFDATRKKYINSLDLKSIEGQQLLNELSTLSIYQSLLNDLQQDEGIEKPELDEHNTHWFDLVNHLFKMRNEPWRHNLLKNCIRQQAKYPGSVSNKTAWKIAMLEEEDFHDIYDFLRLTVRLDLNGKFYGYVLLGYYAELTSREYTKSTGGTDRIEHLFDRLETEENLTLGNGTLTLEQEANVVLTSKTKKFQVIGNGLTDDTPEIKYLIERGIDVTEEKKKSQLFGITLNKSGHQISKFCEWDMSDEAEVDFIVSLERQAQENNLTIKNIR